ncbi:TatD family hydrolase [Mesobacillus selenatarsenatis]|uniref:Putative deoxyribonuclease similar to YcfH, type 3 n=1 Tax=Mesobacillus selenatarsenatis (strain DSM 18680 / JCM 14380 / FERM P-15431 / SF-1) TaxID=1321606 RepID=A0A0A8XBH8_MESS1|nr:TatD family hydrolase [Mesobacillus selenatarsenatis]GAM16629.1 putative deoxyribonuclease similar to YcfH, type 3 [Mesobacillus selenatarsenatis SF-1]
MRVFDAHIHFDKYIESHQNIIINSLMENQVKGLITVSMNLLSCKENLRLSDHHPNIYPAFGYHPEQPLPTDNEVVELLNWIEANQEKMVAVGEVGLPYYLRKREKGSRFPYQGYVEVLEHFILLAKRLNKPIILHAIYDDASVVCDLLEKHNVRKAHFHWFKGNQGTMERMAQNEYLISFTPDILYEEEIREVAEFYPLHLIMGETDGPWPFEGIFQDKLTHPSMVHHVVQQIAAIKKVRPEDVYNSLYNQVKSFYQI